MKITQATAQISSEGIPLRIDERGFTNLMVRLSNLYVNPPLAVLREYLSNALDSHQRADQTRPVEIDLLAGETGGMLTIRDHGTGMSHDEIVNIYTVYGVTTKADTNRQIGGYGLGCKSALAVADSFEIESIHDGEHVRATITKNNDGIGILRIRDRRQSGGATGFTVRIPLSAEQVKVLNREIPENDFLLALPQGSVLFNNQVPASVGDSAHWLPVYAMDQVAGWVSYQTELPPVTARSWRNGFRCAVGGVMYPFDEQAMISAVIPGEIGWVGTVRQSMEWLGAHGHQILLNLPVGSVDIAPSREGLQATEKTARTILTAVKRLVGLLPATLQQRMDACENMHDALRIYRYNRRYFGPATVSPPNWRDTPIPVTIPMTQPWITVKVKSAHRLTASSLSDSRRASFNPNQFDFALSLIQYELSTEPDNWVVICAPQGIAEIKTALDKRLPYFISRHYGPQASYGAVLLSGETVPDLLRAAYDTYTLDEVLAHVTGYRKAERAAKPAKPPRAPAYPVLNHQFPHMVSDVPVSQISTRDTVYLNFVDSVARPAREYDFNDPMTNLFRLARGGSVRAPEALMVDLDWFLAGKQLLLLPEDKSVNQFRRVLPGMASLPEMLYMRAVAMAENLGPDALWAAAEIGPLMYSLPHLARTRNGVADENTRPWLIERYGDLAQGLLFETGTPRLRLLLSALQNQDEIYRLGVLLRCVNWEHYTKTHTGVDPALIRIMDTNTGPRLWRWQQIVDIHHQATREVTVALGQLIRRYWSETQL